MKSILLVAAMFIMYAASAQKDTAKKDSVKTVVVHEYDKYDTAKDVVIIYLAPDGNVKHEDHGNIIFRGTVVQRDSTVAWKSQPIESYYDRYWRVIPKALQGLRDLTKPQQQAQPANTQKKKQ